MPQGIGHAKGIVARSQGIKNGSTHPFQVLQNPGTIRQAQGGIRLKTALYLYPQLAVGRTIAGAAGLFTNAQRKGLAGFKYEDFQFGTTVIVIYCLDGISATWQAIRKSLIFKSSQRNTIFIRPNDVI